MSQTTLDDDDLFGEAAEEVRDDVETHLAAAIDELPSSDAIWDVESENTLGALNGLRSALDIGEARDHLHDAKKWYTLGERAEAFEDASDLETDIEAVETLIVDIESAFDSVGELTAAIPDLRGRLDDLTESE